MELFIARHSEASFSPTFCPECGQQNDGEFLPK